MRSFPSPQVAKVASVLLRHPQKREVYETAGSRPNGGSGRYSVTYSAGTEAEGVELTEAEVEWMVKHRWLQRDFQCPQVLYPPGRKYTHQ